MSALMALLMGCVYVFGPYRNRWIAATLVPCLVYFMRLTGSRTGFGGLIAGVAVLLMTSFFLQRRGLIKLRMRVTRTALISSLIIGLALGLAYDVATNKSLSQAIIKFAQKGKATESLSVDDLLSSRQGLIDLMWANFLQSPWIGIGFEVSTHPYFIANATLFNAPIEKGFLPVAILEETGIIGTTFFVLFLTALTVSLARDLNVPGLAMVYAFLVINCGEAMFFSFGGHGGYGWLLITAGIMFGQHCVIKTQPLARRAEASLPVPASLPNLRPTYSG